MGKTRNQIKRKNLLMQRELVLQIEKENKLKNKSN